MTMRQMTRTITLALVTSGLLATSALAADKVPAPAQTPVLRVTGATVPAPLPGADALAAFMTLANPGSADVTLIGATSPEFGRVELHDVVPENGMLRMKQLPQMTVPAKGQLVLRPKSTHIMLIAPKQPLKAGDKVHLTINLAGRPALSLTLPVQTYKW
jgi:copper(I)-binding protein